MVALLDTLKKKLYAFTSHIAVRNAVKCILIGLAIISVVVLVMVGMAASHFVMSLVLGTACVVAVTFLCFLLGFFVREIWNDRH